MINHRRGRKDWVPGYRQSFNDHSNMVHSGTTGREPWGDTAQYLMHDAGPSHQRHEREPWVRVTCWCEAEVIRVPQHVFDAGMTAPCSRAECVRFDVEITNEQRAR